jgi:hypothetical protein
MTSPMIKDGGLLQNPKLNGTAQELRRPEQRLHYLTRCCVMLWCPDL